MCDLAGFFYLRWKFYHTLHALYLTKFLWFKFYLRCAAYKFYIRTGHILVLKNKAFFDGVHLPEMLEINLRLKVYDGNLGGRLT